MALLTAVASTANWDLISPLPSDYVHVLMCVHAYINVSARVCAFMCMLVCMHAFALLSDCLSSGCLPVSLPACLPDCLSVCISVCMFGSVNLPTTACASGRRERRKDLWNVGRGLALIHRQQMFQFEHDDDLTTLKLLLFAYRGNLFPFAVFSQIYGKCSFTSICLSRRQGNEACTTSSWCS